jgi:hypothetical protein
LEKEVFKPLPYIPVWLELSLGRLFVWHNPFEIRNPERIKMSSVCFLKEVEDFLICLPSLIGFVLDIQI